ncbi:MAG: TonB-dependent receptor [Cyclobacteriaceae bacterium]
MKKKYKQFKIRYLGGALAVMLLFLISGTSHAQENKIAGVITDELNEPMPGVNIIIDGTSTGTVSDINGKYSIVAKSGDVLKFTMVGFKSESITVGGQSVIDVSLTSDVQQLSEVVVVGYGEVKRRDLTGATGSVKVDEMIKAPVGSFENAMAGRIAGVQVTSSQGKPGAPVSIKIRGTGSLSQSSAPLWVIDGFPMEDFDPSTMDQSDIETMEVLKGPSAVAIYGARGGNGVIMITTKNGVPGQVKVNYSGFVGQEVITKRLDVLSPYDFVDLRYEVDSLSTAQQYGPLEGYLRPDGTSIEGISWQDEVFRKTVVKSHTLSVNGGTDNTRYNMSLSRYDGEGLIENSRFERNYVKLKLDQKVTKRLSVGTNISYSSAKTTGVNTSTNILGNDPDGGSGSSARFNYLKDVVQGRPTGGIFYTNEELLSSFDDPDTENGTPITNPLSNARTLQRGNINNTLLLNAYMKYNLLKGLDVRVNAGILRTDQRRESFDDKGSAFERRNGFTRGFVNIRERNSTNLAATLNYKRKVGNDHDVTVLVGTEYQDRKGQSVTALGSGFPDANLGINDLSAGTILGVSQSDKNPTDRVISAFTRVNYTYLDKYLLTATVRRDGSSKFGPKNKFGVFPSFSLAWRFADEAFVKESGVFSDGKLRMEWGRVGNNRIPPFKSQAVLTTTTYGLEGGIAPAVQPSNFPNPDLRWESQEQINIGADLGFLDNRITVTADLYRKDSKDLLLAAPIPSSNGFTEVFRNIGSIRNEGIELAISSVNIDRKLKWSTNFNITSGRNKTLALAASDTLISNSEWYGGGNGDLFAADYVSIVGLPFGQMYGYIDGGLYGAEDFDENGDPYITVAFAGRQEEMGFRKLVDMNGDSIINTDDKVILGNSNPKFYGGMSNNFSYKGFDLNIFLQWSYGNEVYNANRILFTQGLAATRNFSTDVLNRWRTDRTDEENAGATLRSKDDVTNALTDVYIEDGSFVRLKTVSLGYSLSQKWLEKIKAQNVRFYVTAQNLLTLTNYSGFDPEVSTRGNGLTDGVDFGAYPRTKVFIGGISVTF